jgi:glyoxylase-like metal-dependent hydrolase (beta-lactamase superfamily II)
MVQIDILLAGIPGRTDQGYLGQSTVALVDGTTLVDTGGPSRKPLLAETLDAAGTDPDDIEDVLLTHLHFDHCDNVDALPAATVHVYGPELDRVDGDTDWATSAAIPDLLAGRDVRRFGDGDRVAGLEAVHTPGHAAEHVSFLGEAAGEGGERVTYGLVGDAIKNCREFATREPTAIHDAGQAARTIDALADRLDFVVPGHDVPFYVEDGRPVPCGDVRLELALQTGPDAGTRIRAGSDRETRDLPAFVRDRTRTLD